MGTPPHARRQGGSVTLDWAFCGHGRASPPLSPSRLDRMTWSRVPRPGTEGASVGLLTSIREHRRTVASVSTVSVFSTALVGMALFYEGEATADVDLNDSGVWVTKTSAGLLGRFNYESQALDGTLNAGSASFDVQQDAGRVLLDDAGTGSASPVDVAHLKLSGQVRLPAGAQVASGG